MIIMKKTLLLTLCLVIAMALTGCGSSGDSDSSGGTISGGAGGSIFAGSTVTVLDPAQSNKPIGTGTTSDKGVFSVSGVPFGGPYIVKLTDGEEVVSGVGTRVTTPIFAIVPEVNTTTPCQITPLSQFAYWVARGRAGADAIDLEDVNYALAYVKGATGVDVLNDSPVVGDDSSSANLTKVAKTRAAIKQFEAAVGYAPASPAFTQRVAVLGFDAADGNVDGSIGGDYGKALEDAGALDATELGKAETDKAATGTAFRTKMDELGTAAFKSIVKDALDELEEESGRTLDEAEKNSIADSAAAEAPEIDLNPVVGIDCTLKAFPLVIDVNSMTSGVQRYPFFVERMHADGTHESVDQEGALTCTFDGVQKAAFSLGYDDRFSIYELVITPPEGGFQAGEVVVTLGYKLDGRDFTTSSRIVLVSDGSALKRVSLVGDLWYSSRFSGGIEPALETDGVTVFEESSVTLSATTVSDSGIIFAPPRNLVLTVDKGQFWCEGVGEDNWAASHVVAYEGPDSAPKKLSFEYRFVGNWANDTIVTMTLADETNPGVKHAKTFKLWKDRDALRPITFGRVTDTYVVGATSQTVSAPVNAARYDGYPVLLADVEAALGSIELETQHKDRGSEATYRDVIEDGGKFLLRFDYKAPTNDDAWKSVEDNESDTVAVEFGEFTSRVKTSIVLDLVMPSSED
ncbi:hypothetical protein GGQ74_002421 [Desulfobaculum xiamenense]|uniref:Carboxypeptidase regulatory-like domain-containing protein n=1 Tax=Desulfobaculum xiamenense TaxID=995050 RepID=A0A846QKN4_9BACT|nr:hypothetical protein [Desulfobaculum xiamenense]NJB68748.1 hypothetical protein [Desulfobaculum xiamenense]